MTSCVCNKYSAPLGSFADVERRCSVSGDIDQFLDEIATNLEKWMTVYRCRECGLIWTVEYPFSESHAGGTPCFYIIQTDSPAKWLETSSGITHQLRENWEDSEFIKGLGQEVGPKLCRKEDCSRKRIQLSVMCIEHHFEMIKERPFPRI